MPVSPSPTAPRVLVLDQDAAVSQALCFSLALDGYRVEAVRDPATFAQRLDDASLDEAGVDAVIIGHAPPRILAPELIQRVRARRADTAVLMTVTHPTAELTRFARQDRVSLIEKPLLGDTLLQALDAALAR